MKFKVIIPGEGERNLIAREGETLLEALAENGIYIRSDCGGAGRCKKCKAELITPRGKESVSACETFPKEGETYAVFPEQAMLKNENKAQSAKADECLLAIDIGTSTIALELIDLSGNTLGGEVFNDPLRIYGADVISRVAASSSGKSKEMQALLAETVAKKADELCSSVSAKPGSVIGAAVAANTVMTHILLGYDCSGLGAYPFTPYSLDGVKTEFDSVFNGSGIKCPLYVFPCVSAFFGGDALSGIYSCGMAQSEEVSFFEDLGTNGEMAIGNSHGIIASSVSAGPAFEGSSLSCGSGSVPGAVDSMYIIGEKVGCTTTAGAEPCGICASGVIDAAVSLFRSGIIDRSGNLKDEYSESGFPVAPGVYVTQDDIRQIQQAKAAFKTGAEILTKRFGKEINGRVYVAGNFGKGINPANAMKLGILPETDCETVQIGNSSLEGAKKYLVSGSEAEIEEIKKIILKQDLPQDEEFNELYLKNINFK